MSRIDLFRDEDRGNIMLVVLWGNPGSSIASRTPRLYLTISLPCHAVLEIYLGTLFKVP